MKKILIANRGEIAVRVIRACQELNIATVAVYSTADKDSLHTKIADESVCIGPGQSLKSYLSIPAIMSAAEITGADAIHPGYGFLSENAKFAECCEKYGIEFIGPKAEHIHQLGNKVKAREAAIRAGVPLLPGSDGGIEDIAEARRLANEIGFPIIIKAAAGGGGRGMKIIHKMADLDTQFDIARQEALNFFGNPQVFIERYCEKPRHVEVQLLCDQHGTRLYLGERDCSVQRRHQKLIEEAPCPVFTAEDRKKIGEVAVALANEVGYISAGTVEFLLDQNGQFYFMEVNTRIQVEHPVTELVTGIDLIKEQIRIAQGEKLGLRQEDIVIRGHAIECRINAEDPKTFAPSPGLITDFHQPGGPGIRVDGMVYSGYSVPSNYDSMIAKLITFGKDRPEALARMQRALQEMQIDGIKTNLEFQHAIISHPKFQKGDISTHFLKDEGWVSG
jgi:acetyl-CoA carboxylase, biotin carboxylase subunit